MISDDAKLAKIVQAGVAKTARKPIPKPTPEQKTLAEVRTLAGELQARELEVAKARVRLVTAIRAAAKTVPQSRLARAAGVSRQRVGQWLEASRG